MSLVAGDEVLDITGRQPRKGISQDIAIPTAKSIRSANKKKEMQKGYDVYNAMRFVWVMGRRGNTTSPFVVGGRDGF